MVKLNLLNKPGNQTDPDADDLHLKPDLENLLDEPADDMSLLDFPPVEQPATEKPSAFAPVEEPSSDFVFEEDINAHDGENASEKGRSFGDEDEYESFDANRSDKSNLFKILGAFVALLLVVIAFFALSPLLRSCEEDPGSTASTRSSTESSTQGAMPAANQAPPALPAFLTSQYNQNRSDNDYRIGLASRFTEMKTGNTRHTLVVVTDGYAYTSVYGDTREAIRSYSNSLEKAAGIRPKTVKIEDGIIDGKNQYVGDFSIKTAAVKGGGGSSSTLSNPQNDAGFESSLRSLAGQHKVQLSYVKKGAQSQRGQLKANSYYLRISGAQTAIFSFVKALDQDYPAVNIDKISMFSTNASALNSRNLQANLELLFYTL